jgi:hypothetical protein
MPNFSRFGWLLWPIGSVLFIGLGLMAIPVLPPFGDRVQKAQKERSVATYVVPTAHGDILVTEFRSGTEFNRILQMPNGSTIAEAGWVNQWNEEQIRMIGPVTNSSRDELR